MTDKHIHQYRRKRYKTGTAFFFCIGAECSHKTDIDVTIGKLNICNRCGEPFRMNQYAMRLAKPHCPKCHRSKDGSPYVEHDEHDEQGKPVDAGTSVVKDNEPEDTVDGLSSLESRMSAIRYEAIPTDDDDDLL